MKLICNFLLAASLALIALPTSAAPSAATQREISGLMQAQVGSKDYTELGFRGGHIGIYVSGRAQREVPGAINDWLSKRA